MYDLSCINIYLEFIPSVNIKAVIDLLHMISVVNRENPRSLFLIKKATLLIIHVILYAYTCVIFWPLSFITNH